VIDVRNLTKSYGRFAAVRDLSFRAERGETLGILGPNGAGKTTTMRVLTGYLPPTSGKVSIAGIDVGEDPLAAKRNIGYLPEHPPLYPEMTVRQYLAFVAAIRRIDHRARSCTVDAVIERTRIEDAASRRLGTLSRGYKQRVGLAQAILHNPQVVVLDEPTAGLDPIQLAETRELIRELARDRTVVLSSHILTEVEQLCDCVVILNGRGEAMAGGRLSDLVQRLKAPSLVRLEVRGPAPDVEIALGLVPGVTRVTPLSAPEDATLRLEVMIDGSDPRPRLAAAVVGGGWELIEMTRSATELEQVFLRLVAPVEGAPTTVGTVKEVLAS
jgi:ABC-2 type transport system ATP-binding protein